MTDNIEIRDKPDDPPRRYFNAAPPSKWMNHEFHWLHSERSSMPVVAQWIKMAWYAPGEAGPISPTEMWRRGWFWYAPARPPKQPHRDATQRIDNVR